MSGRRRAGRSSARDRGSAMIEILGFIPLFVLAILALIQLLLGISTAVQTTNAARQGARSASLGQDGNAAAYQALPGWLQGGASVSDGGATVRVDIPLVFPGLRVDAFAVTKHATLPPP